MKNLKFYFVLIFLVWITPMVFAQQEETRRLGKFDKLVVEGSFDIVLKKGDSESLRIESKGLDPKEILTEIIGGRLRIYMKEDNYKNIRTTVYLTFVTLNEASKSGSGNLTAESDLISNSTFSFECAGSGNVTLKGKLAGSSVNFKSNGSGNIDVAAIEAKSVNFSVSGSGNFVIKSGKVDSQQITLSGSGNYESFGLESRICNIQKRGSGNADISVSEELGATINGSGNLRYKGNPKLNNIKTSGSGEVLKA